MKVLKMTGKLAVAFLAIATPSMVLLQSSIRDATAQESTIERSTEERDLALLTDDNTANKNFWKASELIGMNVRGASGDDNIGSINDLAIGPKGRAKYVAVSFGGFLGVGDKLFAVPFDAIEFVREDDEVYGRIDVTEETLKQKEGFNQDKWPAKANATFGKRANHRRSERRSSTDTRIETNVSPRQR